MKYDGWNYVFLIDYKNKDEKCFLNMVYLCIWNGEL